jgi:hypothetical protein
MQPRTFLGAAKHFEFVVANDSGRHQSHLQVRQHSISSGTKLLEEGLINGLHTSETFALFRHSCRQREDGLRRPTSWPLWRCERTMTKGAPSANGCPRAPTFIACSTSPRRRAGTIAAQPRGA